MQLQSEEVGQKVITSKELAKKLDLKDSEMLKLGLGGIETMVTKIQVSKESFDGKFG